MSVMHSFRIIGPLPMGILICQGLNIWQGGSSIILLTLETMDIPSILSIQLPLG